jgi:hypothetical protein
VLAVTATTIGFAYDAGTGDRELSFVFAICYVIGCVAAVLAVRPNGVFTAVIQPPLILFSIVPAAYFLFHSDKIHGVKDLAITCGYPLIERFPLMFFTSAAILVIGLVRHYLLPPILKYPRPEADAESPSHSTKAPRKHDVESTETAESEGVAAGFGGIAAGFGGIGATLSAKLTKLATGKTPRSTRTTATRRRPRDPEAAPDAPRRAPHPATAATSHSAPLRRRPSRPANTEFIEPVARETRPGRPSRPRPADAADPPPPRRARAAAPRDPRRATPPPDRRDPRDIRAGHGQPQRPEVGERPMRRHRYAENDGYEPYDRQPRPAATPSPNGARHPVSRVRYRGNDDANTRAERPKERQPRNWEADSWEYDI